MTKPIIFLLGGKKRAGKNTVANVMNRLLKDKGQVKQFSLARELKEQLCKIRGITEEELDKEKKTYRKELQMFGQGARFSDLDIWARFVCKDIMVGNAQYSIITDYRFPNEEKFVKDVFAKTHWVVSIYIDRETGLEDNDPSEQLKPDECDIVMELDCELSTVPLKVEQAFGKIRTQFGITV